MNFGLLDQSGDGLNEVAVLLPVLDEDVYIVAIVSLEAAVKRAISAVFAFGLVLLILTVTSELGAILTIDIHFAENILQVAIAWLDGVY